MDSTNALMQAVDNPAIDRVAEPLSKAVRGAYEAAGPGGRQAKNALHGVWLGHPLHPVFTDRADSAPGRRPWHWTWPRTATRRCVARPPSRWAWGSQAPRARR